MRALLSVLAALLAGQPALEAQDVELLGKLNGTRPPRGYYERMEQDPGAFRYQRALFRRGLELREAPPIRGGGRAAAAPPLPGAGVAEGRRRVAVTGTFNFPLILGLYSDSPTPDPALYSQAKVQAEFFDGPQANASAAGTIPQFYAELSGGKVTLTGTTYDWQQVSLTQREVTAGESGLGGDAKVGQFIVEIIQLLDDGSVDWGQFDNDGPDGVPNSGDDDGYVDILGIMHPTPGGECNSPGRDDRIWSHKWNLYSAAHFESGPWAAGVKTNVGYATTSPATPSATNPDFPTIRILDYTIQPVTTCFGDQPNTIGVFAHELGHGFGLPDLYNTGSHNHSGIGNWGLMGTGSWGCNGLSSELPCHMTAWSKEFLGWVDVETIPPGTDLATLTIEPVETSGKIYRMDAGDGSGEYFLFENRQRVGFDQNLFSPGLLIWHVDPAQVASRWYQNTVNADPEHLGVWLREADGRNDLARDNGGRGGSSDPFPGSLQRREFHFATDPASVSHDGGAMGVTLMDIQAAGQDLTMRAVAGYQPLTLRTEGSPEGTGLIYVDGTTSQEAEWIFNSAPFQTHTIEASPGVETGSGYRTGFMGWADGADRVREHTTAFQGETFTATYGGTEVRVDVALSGPVQGLSPGTVDFSPGDEEGWVPQGESVVVTAQPRTGFGFVEWTGAFAGRPNPFTMVADAPSEGGAIFDLTFSTAANPATLDLEAATSYAGLLEVENANLPVSWSLTSGSLPEGLRLESDGRILGTAMERGSFPLTFHVEDAIGLAGDVALSLVVEDPVISIERLAAPFLQRGAALSLAQRDYLDREGNRNNAYDLGDFRAFFLRNPNLPRSGDVQGTVEFVIPVGDLSRGLSGKVQEVVR